MTGRASFSVPPTVRDGVDGEILLGLLERAARLRRLALCFVHPDPGHRAAVLELFSREQEGTMVRLAAAWRDADEDHLRESYCGLFLGAAACLPNETAWGDARRLGGLSGELADLQGFYRAFGFELSDAARDMPDHVSVELEFLGVLLVKIAYANLEGWEEHRAVALDGARSFLEAHLGRWAGAFAARLRELDAGSPWIEAGNALEAVVRAECELFGANPCTADTVPAPGGEPEAFTCPYGECEAGAQRTGEEPFEA